MRRCPLSVAPIACALTTLALVLGACGGDDEPDTTSQTGALPPEPPTDPRVESEDPVEAVQAWVDAYGINDAGTACELQTDRFTEADLAKAAEQDLIEPDATCEEGVGVGHDLAEEYGIDYDAAVVTLVSSADDEARVSITFPEIESTVEYVVIGGPGNWQIDEQVESD